MDSLTFSPRALRARLPELTRLARFGLGPLLITLYKEDPRRLPGLNAIEDDEDPIVAGGGLFPLLVTVEHQEEESQEPELLYRTTGWTSLDTSAQGLYVGGLVETRLFFRTREIHGIQPAFYDYTPAGMLYLESRMGQALKEKVENFSLKTGGGGALFQTLPV